VLNWSCQARHLIELTHISFRSRELHHVFARENGRQSLSLAASRSANDKTDSFILLKVNIWGLLWHTFVTSHITGYILLCQSVNEINIVIFLSFKTRTYRSEMNPAPWWVLILTRLQSLEPHQQPTSEQFLPGELSNQLKASSTSLSNQQTLPFITFIN